MNRFTNAYCDKMRNGGKCTARGMFGAKKMKRNCRETCGFCGGKKQITNASKCRDEYYLILSFSFCQSIN